MYYCNLHAIGKDLHAKTNLQVHCSRCQCRAIVTVLSALYNESRCRYDAQGPRISTHSTSFDIIINVDAFTIQIITGTLQQLQFVIPASLQVRHHEVVLALQNRSSCRQCMCCLHYMSNLSCLKLQAGHAQPVEQDQHTGQMASPSLPWWPSSDATWITTLCKHHSKTQGDCKAWS